MNCTSHRPTRQAWRLSISLAALLLLPGAAGAQPGPPRLAVAVDTPDRRATRIFVGTPNGSGFQPVTDGKTRDRYPAFSPDGKLLAYQSTNDLGLHTIMVRPLTGNAPARALAAGRHPQWSPDGTRILFSRRHLNEDSLYVIRADGSEKDSGLKPLTRGQLGRWSPDGEQLAVVASAIVEGQDRWQIRILNAKTLEPRFTMSLPESYGQVVSLDWSPSGEKLLFSVARQEQYQLFVLDPRLPEPKRVPLEGGSVKAPNPAYGSWSADGKEIIFRSMGDASGEGNVHSRLLAMKADGTDVRTLWEPASPRLRLYGTAWHQPRVEQVAAAPKPPAPKPVEAKPEVAQAPPPRPPAGNPEPPAPPEPAPATGEGTMTTRVPGPSKKVHAPKLFVIERRRSPVSVPLASPGAEDFIISIPVLPSKSWSGRRQGVGITLDMEDGSLYRGTFIFSGAPWATIQGRAKGAKVRLIDGKQLGPAVAGFKQGFKLTLKREGKNLIVAVNDQEILSRPLLNSPVKRAFLTLENFDEGKSYFPLGNIYYQPSAAEEPGK